MSVFGENLRRIRQLKNMTQEELAALLGTSKQVISRYENAQRSPKVSTVSAYAHKLGVGTNVLISNVIQDAENANSSGERMLNYLIINGDTTTEVASLLGLSSEDFNRVIAGDLNLTRQQAEVLAKRYGVSSKLFWDETEEIKPAPQNGPVVEELIRLFAGLSEDEQQQILGLVRVMSKAHREAQDRGDQDRPAER